MEKNLGRTHLDTEAREIFKNSMPLAQQIETKRNQQGTNKSRTFCISIKTDKIQKY